MIRARVQSEKSVFNREGSHYKRLIKAVMSGSENPAKTRRGKVAYLRILGNIDGVVKIGKTGFCNGKERGEGNQHQQSRKQHLVFEKIHRPSKMTRRTRARHAIQVSVGGFAVPAGWTDRRQIQSSGTHRQPRQIAWKGQLACRPRNAPEAVPALWQSISRRMPPFFRQGRAKRGRRHPALARLFFPPLSGRRRTL